MKIKKTILEILKDSSDLFEEINKVRYLPYRLMWGRELQGIRRNSVEVGLHRAIKQGLIRKKIKREQVYLALTNLGRQFLESRRVDKASLNLNRSGTRWDGLYRFIFFDIPEKDRIVRDTLRSQLKNVGAVPFQKSVWVTKENITESLNKFLVDHDLSDYISIVEVKEIYNPRLKKLLEG